MIVQVGVLLVLVYTVIRSVLFYRSLTGFHAKICKKNSKTFFFAAVWFPKSLRERIFKFYSFARICDDLVDEAGDADIQKKHVEFLYSFVDYVDKKTPESRKHYFQLFANLNLPRGFKVSKNRNINTLINFDTISKVFIEFEELVQEYEVPSWALRLLISGFQFDAKKRFHRTKEDDASSDGLYLSKFETVGLTKRVAKDYVYDLQVRTETDLLKYGLGVASSIGIVCMHLFSKYIKSDEKKYEAMVIHAASLGIALQLTNISRDIITDAEMGRSYIPSEWHLVVRNESDYTSQFLATLKLIHLAEDYYEDGWKGISFLPKSVQGAVAAALLIYREIGSQILNDVCFRLRYPRRAHTGKKRKILLLLKAYYHLLFGKSPEFLTNIGNSVKTREILYTFRENKD
eukprot:augustus_masked-scaffold_3-processed-gene-2.53-mRNA-1 protein AED:1.00 eAED:1.00 QI:0/-1/0/0/-1/1/1/0/402